MVISSVIKTQEELTGNKLHAKPPRYWHNAMMKDVQKTNLIIFLA